MISVIHNSYYKTANIQRFNQLYIPRKKKRNMSQQLQQLTQVKNKALHTSSAQKIDMNIKKFDQNPNTRIRWIWELIQNAKDTPNKFDRVKIKQQLTDASFKSIHNGNAFTLNELHSLAMQYSTKQEQNTQNSRITGKWGTGFVTTQIISRNIKLSSILKYQKRTSQDSDSNSNSGQIQEKKESVSKKRQNLASIADTQQDQIYYYKKFDDLKLDRSYNDRDQQLTKKIKKTEKSLKEIATQAKNETIRGLNRDLINYYENERNQNSFDTCFDFELKDHQKYDIIEKAVQNVRSLICYALLFNENLSQYKFIDNRLKPKDLSFSISKVSFSKVVRNIYLFKYKLSSQYDAARRQFKNNQFGYILTKVHNQKPIAGIPLEVEGDNWTILKVQQTLSQIFKDFPLIGSGSTKWNAVINSNQFYPNEERSSLMLHNIDESGAQKVRTNKENLEICFQGVKDLYLYLAQYNCQAGLSNLLIFNHQNDLTDHSPSLRDSLKIFIEEIMDTKFIPAKRGNVNTKSKPRELVFISSRNHFISRQVKKQMSKQMNQVFRFLHKDQNTISPDQYFQFYEVMLSNGGNHQYLKQLIKYIYLGDCLKQIEKNKFEKLKQMFKQNTFKKLHQIYQFLTRHELPIWNHCVFLNQNEQFKTYQQKDNLMKKCISPVQEEILDKLRIDFRHQLIHPQFTKYFPKMLENQNFDNQALEKLILHQFSNLSLGPFNLQETHNIQLLLQLLITFNSLPIVSENNFKKFKFFSKLESFKFSRQLNPAQKLSPQTLEQLALKYSQNFAYYFTNQITINRSLGDFTNNVLVDISQENVMEFLENLFRDPMLGQRLASIPIKLSMSKNFIPELKLRKLDQDIELPNDNDIEIYQILNVDLRNRQINLEQRIVLNIYPPLSLQKIASIKYKQLFQRIIPNYDTHNLTPQNKQKVINYAKQISDSFTKVTCVRRTAAEKHNAWKSFIDERHVKLFDLKKQLGAFNNEEVKDFLFELINDPQKLIKDAQEQFKRNRNDSILAMKSSQSQPSKKTKKE